jgi:cytochrome c oxidase subunit III
MTAVVESHHGEGHPAESLTEVANWRPKANRLGLWLFILSETFLFAGFISGRYIVDGTNKPEHLNQALALGLTIVLLVSSISAYLAEQAIAHDDRRTFLVCMSITVLLGFGFMGGVAMEFSEAARDFPVHTIYGTNFYMLIGLHSFHVLTGAIALLIALNLGRKGHFGSHNSWFVEATVKYWHFVDLAWVVIYPTLYLVGR